MGFADISLTTGILDAKTNSTHTMKDVFLILEECNTISKAFVRMIRRDASTKFGTGNKVGYFLLFTAGWVISDEGFFGEDKKINFMKLRASYGTLGK
jgi:hypothetical protein